VEDPISEEVLRGNYKGKTRILVSVKTDGEEDKHLYFESDSQTEPTAPLQEAHETT